MPTHLGEGSVAAGGPHIAWAAQVKRHCYLHRPAHVPLVKIFSLGQDSIEGHLSNHLFCNENTKGILRTRPGSSVFPSIVLLHLDWGNGGASDGGGGGKLSCLPHGNTEINSSLLA